jgi:hypothetical protein
MFEMRLRSQVPCSTVEDTLFERVVACTTARFPTILLHKSSIVGKLEETESNKFRQEEPAFFRDLPFETLIFL